MTAHPHISVIICTRNRADSLLETLQCLERADRSGLKVDIVVVDNDGQDNTREEVAAFASKLPVRYLLEPREGKSYCLNRALDEGGLGEIVAILDDDMNPREDWFQGITETCRRHPEFDIFGGRVYAIFPAEVVPGWAQQGVSRLWAISVIDKGEKDMEMGPGEWPAGGHFWVRSRVFDDGTRFRHLWATEPELALRLNDRGFRSMWAGRAVAGHRIQPGLLSLKTQRARAALLGRDLPHVRLHNLNTVPQAVLRKNHPYIWAARCAANLVRWAGVYLLGCMSLKYDKRIERQLVAIVGMSNNLECLRLAIGSTSGPS